MTLPVYFISHGGGPWPYMPEAARDNAALAASLRDIPRQIGRRPAAILMVSAHWEAAAFTVATASHPGMVYDYYGFPENTYHINYPAPGSPDLARRVFDRLNAARLPAALDDDRGFDHGAFVPAHVMYPGADVPMVQLSLHAGYDSREHLALGRALAPLRDEDVLIVGSGLSYHNLRLMGSAGALPSARFDEWLQQVVVDGPIEERTAQLEQWASAPSARLAHPREDHLIPLMVAVGAAESDAAVCVYHETTAFGGITASSFRFGSTGSAISQPSGR